MGSPREETRCLPSRNSAGQGDTCGASVGVRAFNGFPGEKRGVGVGLSGENCHEEWVEGEGGQELWKQHKSMKDCGSSWLGRKLLPGSGTRGGRQAAVKKALMGRAGFYFINVGGLSLSVFFSQDLPTPCDSGFPVRCLCFSSPPPPFLPTTLPTPPPAPHPRVKFLTH